MGRYSDTNVEKSAILLLKIEQSQGRSNRELWEEGVKLPLTVKFRQKSCKIQVKILTFSGKICVRK
jgi:hypothetical protein